MIDDDYVEPYDSPPEEEALLTQKEAVEIFGVSRQTFTKWRDQGLIPTYRVGVGRAIGFKRADIEELSNTLKQIRRI